MGKKYLWHSIFSGVPYLLSDNGLEYNGGLERDGRDVMDQDALDRDVVNQDEFRLPPLRSDIELTQDVTDQAGAPMWLIHDPLQHRYFQIDESTLNLLSIWKVGLTPAQLTRLAIDQLGLSVGEGQVVKLVTFLRASNLTHEDQSGNWRSMAERADAAKNPLFWQLAHKYLFFRLPLLRPQRLLEKTLPYVEPFYSRAFATIVLVSGLAGLYLASRQWDQFLGTFSLLFSFEGIVYFLMSLVFLKCLHELGHAYTAVRFGCRVPTMGIAFMLLTPLLYTDVSDAWRLPSRKKRMIISAAGLLVELALALLATLIWAFLPDGTGRTMVFMIATTGWIMSLGFNLNPFLKFDGYYLLSDFLRVDNLQSRAFSLARWKLRRLLFAPTLAPPEQLSQSLQTGLIIYAFTTWVYRLVIFTAIALFLYNYTFKVLGLFLFTLEIWLLVLRPIWQEIANWRDINGQHVSWQRMGISSGLAGALLLLFVVPWSTRIEIPAILLATDLAYIYPPNAAKVIGVSAKRGKAIDLNGQLLQLQVPDIDRQITGTIIKRDLARLRLSQVMTDRKQLDQLLVLNQELTSHQSRLDGLTKQKLEMVVRSPIRGTVLQLATDLHEGRWVGKNDLLAIIASGNKQQIKGYISGTDLVRLKDNARGRFIPEDITRGPIEVELTRIAKAGSRTIDVLELASINGGGVAVEPQSDNRLVPVNSQYLVEMQPLDLEMLPNQIIRGTVNLEGSRTSLLQQIWRQVSKVLIRESGF